MKTRISVAASIVVVALLAVTLRAQQMTPRATPAARGAEQLRRLYFSYAFNDGVTLGDSLVARFPSDWRIRTWYVANLGGARFNSRADSITAQVNPVSRDPWALAARAIARSYSPAPSKLASAEAIKLTRRARSLAPRDPDFAWAVAHCMFATGPYLGNAPEVVAFADSALPRVGNPIELQLLRANALFTAAGPGVGSQPNAPPDSAKRAKAFAAFAAVRAADTTNIGVLFDLASRVRASQPEEALHLMERAASLSPRSAAMRSGYWATIQAQRGPSVAEKQALVSANRSDFLAVTDSAPWALETVIQSMRAPAGRDPVAMQLEERILARAPRSPWAENVLLNRASQWRDSLSLARDASRPGPKPDSIAARRRYIEAMESFINKPWTATPAPRDQAILTLFFEVRDDSTYDVDKLVRLARQLQTVTTTPSAPGFRYGEAARALANRKADLPYAEQLAREGLKHTANYLNDFPGYVFTSIGDKADALDGANATLYDNIGVVYYQQGRYADADKQLSHALDLTKKNVNVYYDLGRVRAAQGRDEDAELLYAQGMTIRVRGVNPNRSELLRLYEKRNGSIDGWEKYIASLEEKERAMRKARILATRATDAKVVPSFSLADLDGRRVSSDSVRGQYLVVNFWGTWCGPCVAEMPELQQFYDKYRNDKSITIVTISNDKDLGQLRQWMADHKLTIPTLFDDGFVAKIAKISAFPTTWFIDREGKVQFSAVGNTGALVDEWSWRLEAMRKPVAQP